MRILLSKTDALGDQVLATGLVRRLCEHHRPEVLVWMVREGYEAISDLLTGSRVVRPDIAASPFAEARRLLRSQPDKGDAWCNRVVVVPVPFDAYLPWPPGRDLAVEFGWWCSFLRELDIGLAIAGTIDLNWVDHALVAASGAVARIGTFRKELYPGLPEEVTEILRREGRKLAFTKLMPHLAGRHELDSLAGLAAMATGSLVPLLPDLRVAPIAGRRPKGGRILVAPGAGRAEKIYPVEKLANALKQLVAEGICGWKDFLVVSGPADEKAVAGLTKAVDAVGGSLEAAATGDVGHLAKLLQTCRALVCNDTFIAHLAACLNVPAVAVWGSGHGQRFVPRVGRMVVLQSDIPCAGCEWDCCLDKVRCVRSLPERKLIEGISMVLAEGELLRAPRREAWPSPVTTEVVVARMAARRARDQVQLRMANDSRASHHDSMAQEIAAKIRAEELLASAEAQRDRERSAREREAAAKERAQTLLKEAEGQRDQERTLREAEHAALQEAETLLAAAEAQLGVERSARDQEAAAKAQAQSLLQAAEAQRDLERSLREEESTARLQARAALSAAEAQVKLERSARDQEAAAKEQAQGLLQATEAQRDLERALREQESTARQQARAALSAAEAQVKRERSARDQEAAAKVQAQGMLQAAEAQRDLERTLREQESTARLQAQAALSAAESQVKRERSAREQEAAAKEQAQGLLQAAEAQRDLERSLREQESAARLQVQAALSAAEAQLRLERSARDQEAAAKAQAQGLLQAAEAQRDLERLLREQEITAKEHAQTWAQASEAAKAHWERLCHEAEAQRDFLAQSAAEDRRQVEAARAQEQALRAEVDRLNESAVRQATTLATLQAEQLQGLAQLSALTAQRSSDAFARHLAAEQFRLFQLRHTLFGRWLAMRNAGARWLRRAYCLARRKSFVPIRGDPGPGMVQINTHDIIGGAERASYDLHTQFRERGLKPTLIVGGKYSQDADVFKVPFRDIDWKPARVWRDRWGLTEVLYPAPMLGCFNWPELRRAHVVHIHNMHGQFWNSATLLPLGMQHPLVVTLHDEYTMTGDCCYTYDCERWTRGCGKCPQIGLERSARYSLGERDLTRLNVHLKRFIFRAPRAYPLVIVTPSDWLADRARRSPNLRHLPIVSINNGVDLDYWHPLPQDQARRALGLPEGKTIGLLVASHLSDRRKGFDVALDAIRRLPGNTNLLFVLVGNITDEARAAIAGLPIIATGYVSEKIKMLNLFSASDFTFAMSRVDNLPYMCVESLACGRPVFGSAVGGIPEIVSEPALGWLAPQPFDSGRIADTLVEIDREPSGVRTPRFAACRRSAEARFSLNLMVERYLALYAELQAAAAQRRAPDLTKLAPASSIP